MSTKKHVHECHSSIDHFKPRRENTRMSLDGEWRNKWWYIHTMEYYLATKRMEHQYMLQHD